MSDSRKKVSLGFTEQKFPVGVHVCQIYSDDDERQESLLKYILSGIQSGERTSCFSEKVKKDALCEFLAGYGISCDELEEQGAFSLAGSNDVYFQDDRFDQQRMLNLLKQYYLDSVEQGFTASRVIGEMTPKVYDMPGGQGLLEYESRVSLLLEKYPVTAVCQYSAHDFDGAVIMDILKVHPFMIIRGSVVNNPFFIPPEEFLAHYC